LTKSNEEAGNGLGGFRDGDWVETIKGIQARIDTHL